MGVAKPREAGIDVSAISEQALARALELEHKRVIKEEMRRDRGSLAQYIAEHGDPVAKWNQAFGPPGAA